MRFRNLFIASICCILPLMAADKDKDGDDTITVYNVELPLQMPKEKPDAEALASLEKNSKNKKMMELREAVQLALKDIQGADSETDPKKKKRAVEKSLAKLETAAKKFFKEFEKNRKKPNSEFLALKKEKERTDAAIEKAEEAGNDKQATALAQKFDKKNAKYESLQKSLESLNALLYFEELPDIAEIVSGLELRENDIPELLKLAELMKKDGDKAKEKKKAVADDDGDKPDKKAKKKKARKKDAEE